MGSFKVIIAGGSLVGLTLALVLERARIHYELFEKGKIAPQLGASIGLHPQTLRLLEQLGVSEYLERLTVPLRHRLHFDEQGTCFEDSFVTEKISRLLGKPMVFIERRELLRVLYEHINDKATIHDHTPVLAYNDTEDGVTVTVAGGASHHGHVLIGADGTHSQVRNLLAEKTVDIGPQNINETFRSECMSVFGVSHNVAQRPFMPDGTMYNSYYTKYSTIAVTGVPGLVFWFLFIKAPLSRIPSDLGAVIDRYRETGVGPDFTIGDLWRARVKASMAPLEEGVLPRWSHGRVLLLGDSVHKATINLGLGGNLAFEAIAHVTNRLVSLLDHSPDPSLADLNSVFEALEHVRRPRAKQVIDLSRRITDYEAQDTRVLKFFSRYISPLISDGRKARWYAKLVRGAPLLQFLPQPI